MSESVTEFNSESDNILVNNTLLRELLLSILPQKPFNPSIEDLVKNANSIVQKLQITAQKISTPNYVFKPSIEDLINNVNLIIQGLQITPQKIIQKQFNPSILDLVNNANSIVKSLQITAQKISLPTYVFNPSILDLVNNANSIVKSLQITPQKISLPTYTFKPSINDLIENAMFIFRGMLLPIMDESKTEFDEKSLPNRFVLSTIDEQSSILDNKYLVEVKKEKDSAGNDIYGIVNKIYDGQRRVKSNNMSVESTEDNLGSNYKLPDDIKINAMKSPQSNTAINVDDIKSLNIHTLSFKKPVIEGGINETIPVTNNVLADDDDDDDDDEKDDNITPLPLRSTRTRSQLQSSPPLPPLL